MANQNQVNITGRLGQDAEFKSFNNGGGVCNFSVAVSETWLDKNSGDRQEKTEWIPVAMFSKGAEKLTQYLTKGTQVRVTGKFKTRVWENNGVKQQRTEVVVDSFGTEVELLGSLNKSNQQDQNRGQQQSQYNNGSQNNNQNDQYNNSQNNNQQNANYSRNNQAPTPQGNQQQFTNNATKGHTNAAGGSGPVDDDIPFAPCYSGE